MSPIGSSCAGGEAQGLVHTRQSPSLSHTSSTIKLLTNQRQRKEPLREMKRKTTEKTNFLDNRFLIPNYVNQRKRYKNCESRILYPVKKIISRIKTEMNIKKKLHILMCVLHMGLVCAQLCECVYACVWTCQCTCRNQRRVFGLLLLEPGMS